jgi:hypothetical protein
MPNDQIQITPVDSFTQTPCDSKTAICEETARVCVERFGEKLRALVLTGSLARDEATFVNENTCRTLLGDADFFLVLHDSTHRLSIASLESAGQEVKSALQQRGVIASIGLGAVDVSYLRRMPPHISTFELRSFGCVVWGDSSILSRIPEFSAAEISLEDPWRMLANRMIELLGTAAPATGLSDFHSRRDIQYSTVKLYLDMATSYLVFAGRYQPTYRERARALNQLAEDRCEVADRPFPLRTFAERVSDCTRFKLDGETAPGTPDELWKEAIQYAYLLWRWELKRLTGETGEPSDSELMLRWMDRQPVKAKIRGWASVLRRSGWRRSWREWPRWIRLGWTASPRYWVYSLAAQLFFGLSHDLRAADLGKRANFEELQSSLPLFERREKQCPPIGWLNLCDQVVANYRLFLETTSA